MVVCSDRYLQSGQARKSLWIETTVAGYFVKPIFGQARKSLWIETLKLTCGDTLNRGQARKSLWIETFS